MKCFIHEMTNQQVGLSMKCQVQPRAIDYSTAALCPGISHSATATQAASVLFSAQHRSNVVLFTALLLLPTGISSVSFLEILEWKMYRKWDAPE